MVSDTLCPALMGQHHTELRRLRHELRDDPPGDPGPIFEDAAGNPFEDPARVVFADELGWAHRRYRFDLVVDGTPALFGVSYRADIDSPNPPDPTRMVEAVLEDVASVRGVRHWEDFADEHWMLEDARSRRAAKRRYRYLKRRERLLRKRLGWDVLDELLTAWAAGGVQ